MEAKITVSCLVVLLLSVSTAGTVGGVTAGTDDVELPPIEPAADRHWTTLDVWLEADGSARVRLTVNYANEEEPLAVSDTPYADPEKREKLQNDITDALSRLEQAADSRTSREMSVEFVDRRTLSSGETRVSYRFNYRWDHFAAVDGDRYVVDQPLARNHSILHDVFRFGLTPPREGLYALESISDGHERTKLGGRLHDGVSDWIQFTEPGDLTGYRAVFAPADTPTPTPSATESQSTATRTSTETPTATVGAPDEAGIPLLGVGAAILVVLVIVLGIVRRNRRR